jgi:DNA-binding transcriptional LysR family regulator
MPDQYFFCIVGNAMLDIKPLRYFVALAETRHFGRAAARLNLSQPPLSRQLASLEEDLGVTLVRRTSRTVELTAAGERFYADAVAILAATEQAVRNARAADGGEAGTLAVGFTMCAAYSVVPGYARAYGAAYPAVALHLREVVSNDLQAQLLAGRIDAAVMFPTVSHPDLRRRTVVREPLYVALARNHRLARARRLNVAKLAGEPFVVAAREVAPGLHDAIMDHCRQGGFEPDVRLEVHLQQTLLSLVNEGVGVALVPASMRKAQMEGVVMRPLVDAPLIELVLAWSALPGHGEGCITAAHARDCITAPR